MSGQNELIQRIILRRKGFGASQDQAAEWAGMTHARLRSIEAGEVELQSTEFEQLCRGLAIDPSALFAGKEESPHRSVARFRAAVGTERPSPDDTRLLALAGEVSSILGQVSEDLRRPPLLRQYRDSLGIAGRPGRQGETLGAQARKDIVEGRDPILDLQQLLEALGIHVAYVTFSDRKIDAASIWACDSMPMILLNVRSRRVKGRLSRRAVLAHEFCHLLHDATRRGDIVARATWGDSGSGNYEEDLELRARSFGPSFLAPRAYVSEWWKVHGGMERNEPAAIRALARTWGLSFGGASWYAYSMRWLRKDEAARMASTHTRIRTEKFEASHQQAQSRIEIGGEYIEPATIWAGLGLKMIAEAVETGVLSRAYALEILQWR
jgi:Zn-dependent peptidase ImmA (M78 family)